MICGTLLAAYMQVVEYGLVFEVQCIFAHKKTAPCELEGMSNFWGAVQGLLRFSDDLRIWANLIPLPFYG